MQIMNKHDNEFHFIYHVGYAINHSATVVTIYGRKLFIHFYVQIIHADLFIMSQTVTKHYPLGKLSFTKLKNLRNTYEYNVFNPI